MDIEAKDLESGNTSGTEVLEDHPDDSPIARKQNIKARAKGRNTSKVIDEDDEAFTMGQIANKFNKQSKNAKFFNRDSDDEDEDDNPLLKKSNPGKKAGASKGKGDEFEDDLVNQILSGTKKKKTPKKSEAEIVGPLTGQTIVLTGVLDQISREDLTDLLKNFGA